MGNVIYFHINIGMIYHFLGMQGWQALSLLYLNDFIPQLEFYRSQMLSLRNFHRTYLSLSNYCEPVGQNKLYQCAKVRPPHFSVTYAKLFLRSHSGMAQDGPSMDGLPAIYLQRRGHEREKKNTSCDHIFVTHTNQKA